MSQTIVSPSSVTDSSLFRKLNTRSREIGHVADCFLSMEIHPVLRRSVGKRMSVTELLNGWEVMAGQVFHSVVEPFVGRAQRFLGEILERGVIHSLAGHLLRVFRRSSRMKNFHRRQLRMMNILPVGGGTLREMLFIERAEGLEEQSLGGRGLRAFPVVFRRSRRTSHLAFAQRRVRTRKVLLESRERVLDVDEDIHGDRTGQMFQTSGGAQTGCGGRSFLLLRQGFRTRIGHGGWRRRNCREDLVGIGQIDAMDRSTGGHGWFLRCFLSGVVRHAALFHCVDVSRGVNLIIFRSFFVLSLRISDCLTCFNVYLQFPLQETERKKLSEGIPTQISLFERVSNSRRKS